MREEKRREAMGPEDRKVLSFAEVSLHSVMKDCWVIINGKVIDHLLKVSDLIF